LTPGERPHQTAADVMDEIAIADNAGDAARGG